MLSLLHADHVFVEGVPQPGTKMLPFWQLFAPIQDSWWRLETCALKRRCRALRMAVQTIQHQLERPNDSQSM